MAEHLQIGPRKVDLTGMLCIRPATLLVVVSYTKNRSTT